MITGLKTHTRKPLAVLSMSDPFFKIRPSKRSNPEARTTLETVHQHYLSKIKDVGEQISIWKDQQTLLYDKLKEETEEMQRYRIEQEIKEIQNKINVVDKKDAITFFKQVICFFNTMICKIELIEAPTISFQFLKELGPEVYLKR